MRAVLTRGRGRIQRELIEACPRLEVVARAGAGVDNIDLAAARERGVRVLRAPGVNARTVAEHTLALMLDVVRGVTRWANVAARGDWGARASYAGGELAGGTLGIVGYGAIGRRVAELADAFGMRVLVARHPERGDPTAGDRPALALPELLERVDVLSLHVPEVASTRGLVGASELARLRPGAVLVNTSRGALVDGAALRAAIADGRLAGFAADVLDVEPPPADDPLLRSERVVITPHVASLTAATYRELCLTTVRNVLCVLRGEAPDAGSEVV